MFQKLIQTPDDRAAVILRWTLAIVMFPHAAQKVLGWFGGSGLSGTLDFFTSSMGLPTVLALLVIFAEFLGSLGLAFGLLTRVAAFGILSVMLGAVFMVHLPNGFFMNWYGDQKGEGFEYHLLAIGIALFLMVRGGGALSVDRVLSSRRPE
ncbi:MAG: DoxX family protein [Acidobacteria bacterium]|nr:DoxX family protein [Acidobacteriota bacterium]